MVIAGHKGLYAKEHAVMKDLHEVVKEVKPTILIGRMNKILNQTCRS